ncbi:MAG: histidine acid phosphatase [Dysgonamonadaceae bacterium]
MKKIVLLVCLFGLLCGLHAQTAQDEIYADVRRSGGNYYAYPEVENWVLTPAPQGYKPFYISAYARHGSRFLISDGSYTSPLQTLKAADQLGKLTPLGQKVMAVVGAMSVMSDKRLGELTPLGAIQHQGIAQRMYRNFPEVFQGQAAVDARSTVVIRCILSMLNECNELKAKNPRIDIKTDASQHDMYYMNDDAKEIRKFRDVPEVKAAVDKFRNKYEPNPERLMNTLFSDISYARDSVNGRRLMKQLFDIASNMQSHKHQTDMELYSIFTKEECYKLWLVSNFQWYVNYGASPLTQGKMPYMEANLLKNMLDTADSCVSAKTNGATLRFGHDTCVLPLQALMELGDCGIVIDDPEQVADKWRTYNIVGMADNVQLVFYRKNGSKDVLVKALLNEKEVTMPVATDIAPYYHWKDVEAYYRAKLAR